MRFLLGVLLLLNFSQANANDLELCLQDCKKGDLLNCFPLGHAFTNFRQILDNITKIQEESFSVNGIECNKTISADDNGIIYSTPGECLVENEAKPEIFYPNKVSGEVHTKDRSSKVSFNSQEFSPKYTFDWGGFTFDRILRKDNFVVWLTNEKQSEDNPSKCWSAYL